MGLPSPPTPEEYFKDKPLPKEEKPPAPDWHDPMKWVQSSQPNVFVKLQNIESRTELNGQLALVVGYDRGHGRYIVHLCMAQTRASFKPEKLQRASWLYSLLGQVQIVRYNPEIQKTISSAFSAENRTKSYSMIAALVLTTIALVVSAYKLGFGKTLTIASSLIIVALLVVPDLVSGKSVQETLSRLPYNTKLMIRESAFPFAEDIAKSNVLTGLLMSLFASSYLVWTIIR